MYLILGVLIGYAIAFCRIFNLVMKKERSEKK